MPTRKTIGFIAMITPPWFLAVYLVMSAMRADYSHWTRAISELGSLDAPHLWAWNILGYILPGLAIALLGVGLAREFRAMGRAVLIPAGAVVVAGLLMALSGVFPADMADFGAPTTRLHLVGSIGCYIAFLVAGFWLPAFLRKSSTWHWVARPSLALVLASIALGFLRMVDGMGGVGQRLTFSCFFLWVAVLGFALWRANSQAAAEGRGA